MNIVVLKGNLTRDPEVKEVKGTKVAQFTLAVNEYYKTKDGEAKEISSFIDCEAWDSGAELIEKLLTKGSSVLVNGSIRQDRWEKDGQKFSKLKVRVQNFDKLNRRQKEEEQTEDISNNDAPVEVGAGEDIPF